MAYVCPRCGEKLKRAHNVGARVAGGLVGALLYSAFGSFECPKCGKIARKEFPPEVRKKMNRGTLGMVTAAVAILLVVIIILILSAGS